MRFLRESRASKSLCNVIEIRHLILFGLKILVLLLGQDVFIDLGDVLQYHYTMPCEFYIEPLII